jgi:hypothetical protein
MGGQFRKGRFAVIGVGQASQAATSAACAALSLLLCNAVFPLLESGGSMRDVLVALTAALPEIMRRGGRAFDDWIALQAGFMYMNVDECNRMLGDSDVLWDDRRALRGANIDAFGFSMSAFDRACKAGCSFVATVTARRCLTSVLVCNANISLCHSSTVTYGCMHSVFNADYFKIDTHGFETRLQWFGGREDMLESLRCFTDGANVSLCAWSSSTSDEFDEVLPLERDLGVSKLDRIGMMRPGIASCFFKRGACVDALRNAARAEEEEVRAAVALKEASEAAARALLSVDTVVTQGNVCTNDAARDDAQDEADDEDVVEENDDGMNVIDFDNSARKVVRKRTRRSMSQSQANEGSLFMGGWMLASDVPLFDQLTSLDVLSRLASMGFGVERRQRWEPGQLQRPEELVFRLDFRSVAVRLLVQPTRVFEVQTAFLSQGIFKTHRTLNGGRLLSLTHLKDCYLPDSVDAVLDVLGVIASRLQWCDGFPTTNAGRTRRIAWRITKFSRSCRSF